MKTQTKEKIKGCMTATGWLMLFIGGMFFGSLGVMLTGTLLDIDFVVEGMYALTDFLAAIQTGTLNTDVMSMLANKAAVLIHTTMCLGYLPVIAVMFARRKEAGGFGAIHSYETADVFKWLSISMAISFGLDLLMQGACLIPSFKTSSDALSSVAVLSTSGMPWLALLTTGILAPIVEEIAFRRGIQRSITKKYGAVVGILVASISFGVMHGNLFQGIFAALMGVLLGVVYEKTGNLWYTTIIHIVNNSTAVLITLLGLSSNVVGAMLPVLCGILYFVSTHTANLSIYTTSGSTDTITGGM